MWMHDLKFKHNNISACMWPYQMAIIYSHGATLCCVHIVYSCRPRLEVINPQYESVDSPYHMVSDQDYSSISMQDNTDITLQRMHDAAIVDNPAYSTGNGPPLIDNPAYTPVKNAPGAQFHLITSD